MSLRKTDSLAMLQLRERLFRRTIDGACNVGVSHFARRGAADHRNASCDLHDEVRVEHTPRSDRPTHSPPVSLAHVLRPEPRNGGWQSQLTLPSKACFCTAVCAECLSRTSGTACTLAARLSESTFNDSSCECSVAIPRLGDNLTPVAQYAIGQRQGISCNGVHGLVDFVEKGA